MAAYFTQGNIFEVEDPDEDRDWWDTIQELLTSQLGLPSRVSVGPLDWPDPYPGRSVLTGIGLPSGVIGEIPSTGSPVVSPGDTPRGSIPQKAYIPEGFHPCEIAGEWRVCQDEPEGGWQPIILPPIDEERMGEIIRTQVPLPVDDSEFDDPEEDQMAHTWFHSATELAGQIWGGTQQQSGGPGPGAQTAAQTDAWLAALAADPVRGSTVRCKRRRRRRALLTQSDLNVLNQIANLPNNSNVRTALAKAVR